MGQNGEFPVISLDTIDAEKPVLIYGPTASGKSALALDIAEKQGGVIINADALQVYRGWPVLTAQPSADDLSRAPHHLYGHLPYDASYSAGDWLRDITPLLNGARAIIVGGTGLNFLALTEGLAEIPPIPPGIRTEANAMSLSRLAGDLDPATRAGLDTNNRARVQRAWEVARSTGRSIRDWQADTPPPLLRREDATCLCLMPGTDWLNPRIARRFDLMLENGALAEAQAMYDRWDPGLQSSKAIGAQELIAHLRGECSLDAVRDAAIVASRPICETATHLGSGAHAPVADRPHFIHRLIPNSSCKIHNFDKSTVDSSKYSGHPCPYSTHSSCPDTRAP